MKISSNKIKRDRRHARVRSKIFGTSKRPRLSVFKSNRYVYAQIIDDEAGKTLGASSSLKMKGTLREKAEKVGESIAKVAVEKNINKVVFDRGGFLYTGHIKALAQKARDNGMDF